MECGSRLTFVLVSFIMFGLFADRVSTELFMQVIQTEKAQEELSFILDNLEESIIIFSQDEIEYINDTCLDLFKSTMV